MYIAVLKAHVGERVRNNENMPRLVVDQYGHTLESVTGATGDATRTLHDAFLAALAHSLREVGIKFKAADAQTDLANTSFRTLCMPLWESTN